MPQNTHHINVCVYDCVSPWWADKSLLSSLEWPFIFRPWRKHSNLIKIERFYVLSVFSSWQTVKQCSHKDRKVTAGEETREKEVVCAEFSPGRIINQFSWCGLHSDTRLTLTERLHRGIILNDDYFYISLHFLCVSVGFSDYASVSLSFILSLSLSPFTFFVPLSLYFHWDSLDRDKHLSTHMPYWLLRLPLPYVCCDASNPLTLQTEALCSAMLLPLILWKLVDRTRSRVMLSAVDVLLKGFSELFLWDRLQNCYCSYETKLWITSLYEFLLEKFCMPHPVDWQRQTTNKDIS